MIDILDRGNVMKNRDKTKRVLGRGLSELMSASNLSVDISGDRLSDNDYGNYFCS